MRPDFGEIQNTVAETLCLLGCHCLLRRELTDQDPSPLGIATYNINCPRGEISCFNCFKECLDAVVRVFTAESACGRAIEGLKK